MTVVTGERESQGGILWKTSASLIGSGHIHDREARTDHPNAINAITLAPSSGYLWCCQCELSLWSFPGAARPGQRSSPHGDLWRLALELSYRKTTFPSVSGICPVLPGLCLSLYPLPEHERLLEIDPADHDGLRHDDDQTTAAWPARGKRPLAEYKPDDRSPPPAVGCWGP